jgi:caspase domain-containing protein
MRNGSGTDLKENHGKAYAILIGIDFYFPNKSNTKAPTYKSLGGCVRDINHVEEFLKLGLGIPNDNIYKLTASCPVQNDPNDYRPLEPEDKWPTYYNIIKTFQRIIELAKEGDQIYVHYSGHGGRVPTWATIQKGLDGLDETLVPTDIGNPESRYVRDIEMATLLNRMVEKGLLVTLVLDSCHSGGMTRGGGGAVPRGTDIIDRTARPNESLVASIDELSNTWQRLSKDGSLEQTRDMNSEGNNWLPRPKGYVLLAACRPSELAYEYPFEANERNGALTYFLLKCLSNIDSNITYKIIYDQLVAKIHSRFPMQTPIIEGEVGRVVFGADYIDNAYAVNIMEIDQSNGSVLLNAGQAHGIQKGSEFAIYPQGTVDFSQKDKRLAIVEISERSATSSWAKIKDHFNKGTIEPGSQGVLITSVSFDLLKKVYLVDIDDSITRNMTQLEKEKVASMFSGLKSAILSEGKGFIVETSKGSGSADFQVAINNDDKYEIWDPAGKPIPNLNPELSIHDSNSPSRLVRRLVHLAKYNNVRELDNYDSLSPLRGKLAAELFARPQNFEPGDKPIFLPLDSQGGAKVVRVGQKLVLRIKNNFPSESKQVLNIVVLDGTPNFAIAQIYPTSGYFYPLDPGAEVPLDFTAGLPAQYSRGRDIIKVMAVIDQTSFRWLELDPLDEPRSTEKSLTRGGDSIPTDPLEHLMHAMTQDQALTRDITYSPNASKEWTCVQLEVEVIANN